MKKSYLLVTALLLSIPAYGQTIGIPAGHAYIGSSIPGQPQDGGLYQNSARLRKVVSGTADTASVNDTVISWTSTATSTKTETLYPCSLLYVGRQLIIKDAIGVSASHAIVLTPSAGQTVDTLTTYPIYFNFESITIQCDGISNWEIQ